MKYVTPIYENTTVDTRDIICSSVTITTYIDESGNTVQELEYSFNSIFNKVNVDGLF